MQLGPNATGCMQLSVNIVTHAIDVKKRSNKNLKNVKNVTNLKKTFVNVIKTLPLLSVVQLHARCPRNGLRCISEYATLPHNASNIVSK